MKRNDIIFAAICGLSVSWIAIDLFGKYGYIFIFIFPVLSVAGLKITELIGKRFLFIHQIGKFGLAGAFADVIDIKVFQFLFIFLPIPLLLKTISFIVATFVKYIGDKYWAFEKNGTDGMHLEIAKFFMVAVIGLLINLASFYCATEIIGPQFAISVNIWTELSIIFAALVTAVWNFSGYKFIVFKK